MEGESIIEKWECPVAELKEQLAETIILEKVHWRKVWNAPTAWVV